MTSEYYIEVAPDGPWLTKGGTVTTEWDKRGLWLTQEEAHNAMWGFLVYSFRFHREASVKDNNENLHS